MNRVERDDGYLDMLDRTSLQQKNLIRLSGMIKIKSWKREHE
jgi:hypothetical protein